MKVLINTPNTNGGVWNYYKSLIKYFPPEIIYNHIGKRNKSKIPGILLFPSDVIKFMYKIFIYKPNIIVLNPSLQLKSFIRESIFLKLIKIVSLFYYEIKVVVFFRGWSKQLEKKIDKYPFIFRILYNQKDLFIVLSESFKNSIFRWLINADVIVETTKVDNDLLKDYTPCKIKSLKSFKILFVARIEKYKGVHIAVEAFKIFNKKHPNSFLTIVGEGSYKDKLIESLNKMNIRNITCTGYLQGSLLAQEYRKANIFLFPTVHGEGMPSVVLEAMAFGMPIISRPVGGIVDFFEKYKMGLLIESIRPFDFAEALEIYFNDINLLNNTSIFNYKYSRKRFLSSEVAKRFLENIKYE